MSAVRYHSCRDCDGTGSVDDEDCPVCGGVGKYNLGGP